MVRASTVRDDVGFGLPPVISHSGLAGRLACLFAVAVLLCVSSAQGQVIEEGGFPVKGGGVSGESFSLSCPPRLVVEAGESVALSCSATDVPEEGVRYGWESVSGEGLRLLSASDELSPLFAAPLSEAGEEYAYRLTAMAAGVYRTATVTVTMEGVPGETIGAPIVREECDPFTVPEGLGEGCAEDKGPAPFGFGSEAEGGFLFPEAPGLPDRPSGPVRGGGSVMQAPPRLECPAAIFLEELETGSIECRVFDASGEEHLEYSWEPAGNTTRDYLENPRLIPEDSPTPSVVAPEAPAYETLESFRSVETTFRYRYRLTATSRATGLSSHSEVEVFVSGSRPGVYCPLEVAVEEGSTVALDCEGVDPLSGRMDYDEDGASIEWEWEGLWGASTALLDATDRSSPLFTAPPGSAGEAYHYIASMTSQASGVSRTARRRVTVTVVGGEGGQASSDASALSRKGGAPVVTCEDSEIYEATADFTLACTVTDEPAGAEYRWTGTDISNRLRGVDGLTPTFAVPGDISEPGEANKDYEYTVTLSANGIDVVTAAVTVTVLEKPDIYCARSTLRSAYAIPVPEGTTSYSMRGFRFCSGDWAGAPDSRYMFRWTSLGEPARLSFLSATDIEFPVFHVPDVAPGYDPYFRYGYHLTVSAENADSYTGRIVFTVFFPVLSVSCEKTYYEVYEGSEDFPLACSVSGLSSGSGYEYAWTARGYTADMSLLSAADVASPVFYVPDELAYNTTYSYRLKVSAARARSKTVDVRVKVLDNPNIVVACPDSPYEVYEGSEDFDLECSASGAPEGSAYDYAWTAVRSRTNMALLSAADVASPTFRVPDEVAALGERHEYLLVASAQGADSGQKRVRVTVLDRALAVDCRRRSYEVHEGSEDIAFDCSASGDHSGTGYEYEWTSLGDTPDTSLLSAAGIASPAFLVPDAVEDDEQYAYRLTVRANAEDASVDVSVRVLNLNREALAVVCADPGSVYEGTPDIALDCAASGAPSGSSYAYSWRAGGATANTDLLSATDGPTPTFLVPDEVDNDEIYEYRLTVSAGNAGSATAEVTVTVLNRGALALACADPGAVYEGSADVAFDCTASGAPGGSDYEYAWAARGGTANTDLLSSTDGPTPTFLVPDEVDNDEIYEYRLTVSAGNAGSATAEVTVTVLNRGALALACADPGAVYEGSADVAFDCTASGAPGGSSYSYAWRARGGTSNTDLLSATDGPAPTFEVPDALDETTTYEYLLTVSAANAEDAAAEVTITVLNREALRVACADPGAVYEGSADVAFDCTASGAPSGSSYAYSWRARGATANTDLLSATNGPTPTFLVPDEVDNDEIYEYRLTVSAGNAGSATAEVTVTVLNRGALALACADPGAVYEGSADVAFDCSASGAPGGSSYSYAWRARGGTSNTDLLSATDGPAPTFEVPDALDETTTYEYLLTVSAANAEDAAAEVTVTVLNSEALRVACADPGAVYEGSADVAFDCTASGAPGGSSYEYAWTARGGTADTDLLSATDGPAPTFEVPDALDETTTYEYLLTVSAENAEDASAEVTVTVLNREALGVACANPGSVYEGSEDITLDCSASGAPAGSTYDYVWAARDDTPDTALLIAGIDGPTPTFAVPDEVAATTTYEYLLTVSAEHAESGSAEVTVTVLNKGALAVVCADPSPAYEGAADFDLDCSASGAPTGSGYAYVWTARGSTANTALLIAGTDGPAPTFSAPAALDATTTYEYLLTVSAEHAESGSAEVTVTVLNKGELAVVCADPSPAYEGAADFDLDCSASGAPAGSGYDYVWTARGDTPDTALLIAGIDGPAPTFAVPDEVAATTTYEYLLTVSAANAEDASAEVTVTVLNKEALALACADPGSVYEGSEDITLDCSASGAPEGSDYAYAWTASGGTADTDLLSATDIASPTFHVPDEVNGTTTYEYTLTVSAANAEDASAEVTVTVLDKEALALACADPGSVYEGSEDITLDCSASGAPGNDPQYTYIWTARGDTPDASLLSATDISSPAFYVPDAVDVTTDYEYLLTVSATNAEDASAEVTVTVLNKEALALACADPGSVYEGSEDIAFDCTASGAPGDSPQYTYVWTARGDTPDASLLSAMDIFSPTFHVPEEVDANETYEYLLTVSAANAEDASAEVTVTVLNKEALALACADPGSVYEGSADFSFDCTASGAPEGSDYEYAWTARGDTQDTSLLSATDGPAPTFAVPDDVSEDETYEYLLTVSAVNAEDAAAEVAVTVLDRSVAPPSDPVSPPLASSSTREPAQPSAPGVTASASPLRFGVQSADTQVSLDPMTDQLSTRVSGPYHAGRMTLSPGSSEEVDENGEMSLSIELASPVVLRRKGGVEAALIVLAPLWSLSESCEQLSSQAIGGLYTETTLADGDCRLLLFGGDLDLTDVLPGEYAGSLDVVLRSGENEETHSVEVEVTVVPAQRVITIGPGGVRFSTSREVPVGLTEEQNLSIYPDVAFLTEGKPHGAFELSNPSLIPLEVTVSARFGYTEATADGREVVVEDTSGSHLGDLSSVVNIRPNVLVLQPGEKGLVRYGVQEGALGAMGEKGYAAFFDVASEPRQYVRSDRMPEEVAGDRTARVTMRIPGVYVPREGASQLRATLVSISYVGSLSATFLVETEDRPFAGEVVAYDGDGRELGRREALVYTRSRVRIPLDRMPEEGAVFLRFMPRGSGRVPEPAVVEWDAPRRDIGGIGDKEQTPTSAAIAGKP